jgi:hypothetical protein
MSQKEFRFDVAFSFLASDEGLATRINELLKGRVSTFLYSEQQKALAGRDGEETFNRVFGSEARIVVIFYREAWGTTPWTRMEKTAIRNRAYEEGYGFTLFIPLDTPPIAPDWLPKTQLWFGLDRYGIDAAAPIIERLVEEYGGVARPETADDIAARLSRDLLLENRRQQLRNSSEGVQRAEVAVRTVLQSIEALANSNPGGLRVQVVSEEQGRAIYLNGITVLTHWSNTFVNTTDHFGLNVSVWTGRPDYGGQRYIGAREVQRTRYQPDFDAAGEAVWKVQGARESISSTALAEVVFKTLIDQVRHSQLNR